MIERADKANFWQSVTGSLDSSDEDLSLAAAREVHEETGIDVKLLPSESLQNMHHQIEYEIYPQWRHRYAPGITENREHLFGLQLPGNLPVKLAPDEHVRYEWVDWREAAKRVFSWTNVDAIKRLGERHQLTL